MAICPWRRGCWYGGIDDTALHGALYSGNGIIRRERIRVPAEGHIALIRID